MQSDSGLKELPHRCQYQICPSCAREEGNRRWQIRRRGQEGGKNQRLRETKAMLRETVISLGLLHPSNLC